MDKYSFRGKVIEGQKIGRKLGFPTANFDSGLFPSGLSDGVYSVEVFFDGKNEKYLGVLFFGPKATFNEIKNTLEIHILDFDKNIYGEIIEVVFIKFIRKTKKFSSVNDLVDQIKKDILVAKI